MSDVKSKIESILFAAGRPVKLIELAKTLDVSAAEIKPVVEQLQTELLNRGTCLLEKDGKCQMITNPENAKVVGNFMNAEIREKLTDASMETLAIILYKKPISRAEIEAIRGVNSQYILRQLLIRGLIEKATSKEDARRLVYKTTLDFMMHLGIKDMKELPDFEELTKNVSLPEVQATTVKPAGEVMEDISSQTDPEFSAVQPTPKTDDTETMSEPEEKTDKESTADEDDEDDEEE